MFPSNFFNSLGHVYYSILNREASRFNIHKMDIEHYVGKARIVWVMKEIRVSDYKYGTLRMDKIRVMKEKK